jgi:serine/threonine protein kinase/CheY-like chemotaxis protein
VNAVPLHLLLVDDNEVNLGLLGRRLERKGCTVKTALDGPSALRAIADEHFDAVILDLRMPGMTGLEVLQEIRKTRSQIDLPVIMATAQTDPDDVVATLDAGANDYVTKPIDVEVLHARVRAQVRSRAAARTVRGDAARTRLSAGAAAPVVASTAETSTAGGVDPHSIGIGTTIDDRYRLDELLGTGGFGSVYRARHLKLDADVAVKMLHPHLLGATNVKRRFEQEAISTCRVRHPHAVQVLDAGTSQSGLPYLVMELLTGPTLADELEWVDRFSLRRAAEILVPVCDVLAEAHRVGIVHRDVKPANVVLADSPGGQIVKVLDFGIATFVDRERRTGLTGDGSIGTPLYMSPEALLGRGISPATDVFSVGVTAYVMLAGEPPHGVTADNVVEQAMRQVQEAPTDLARHRPDLPVEVIRVVMAALAREPTHRPTVAELREVIATWADRFEEPVWPLPRATPPSRSQGEADPTVPISGVLGSIPVREQSGVEPRTDREAQDVTIPPATDMPDSPIPITHDERKRRG